MWFRCLNLSVLVLTVACGGADSHADQDPERTEAPAMQVLATAKEVVLSGEATHLSIPLDQGREALRQRSAEKIYLRLQELHAEQPPGIVYSLHLGPPEDETAPRLGTINFFGANPRRPGFTSFEIPRSFVEELSTSPLELTIRPMGPPPEGAPPSVGRIELILDR